MRKLLLVVTKSTWGGAQRYVYDLCANLPRKDFEICVACGGYGVLIDKLVKLDVEVIQIDSLERDAGLWRDIRAFFSFLKLIYRVRPEILHLNSSKVLVLGTIAGKLSGVSKIVITSHGWPFFEPVSQFRRWIYRSLISVAVALADHTITVSKADFDAARRLFLARPERLHLIHNGIKASLKTRNRSDLREELLSNAAFDSCPNSLWIAVVGELTKNKGQRKMIETFCEFAPDNAELFLVGHGEDFEVLIRLAAGSRCGHRIHFTGALPNIRHLIGAFDLLALSSLKEGLPYVILEAGMADVAVIAHHVGGIPDILTHMHNGLLVDPTETEWGIELSRISRDNRLRANLALNLRRTVETRFRLENMINQVDALYRT